MIEQNKCRDLYECDGACCRNNILIMTDQEYSMWIDGVPEEAVNEVSAENFISLCKLFGLNNTLQIIQTSFQEGGKAVGINGTCPHLDDDYNCDMYPEGPSRCRKTPVGSEPCNRAREQNNLPQITLK